MNKSLRTSDLFDCDVPYLKPFLESKEYPWELLPLLSSYLDELFEKGIPGFTRLSDTILVGPNVKIAKTATLEGKCVIGANSEIRPGAYLRGNVITGPNCVLGNSSEFKNCILMEKVQAPHYNYVGDSILGNFTHMGAGSICSNLKSDGKPVVIHGDRDYATGIRKIGAILGDRADIGCGSVLNPGTVIGKGTTVYPLTCCRGVYEANRIVKGPKDIVNKEDR